MSKLGIQGSAGRSRPVGRKTVVVKAISPDENKRLRDWLAKRDPYARLTVRQVNAGLETASFQERKAHTAKPSQKS